MHNKAENYELSVFMEASLYDEQEEIKPLPW